VTGKILVVEDNELNLKLFCDLLGAHGYKAEPVRDGREAIGKAQAFAPDLIVMDIQMPHISGLELIEQIKADESLRAIPIIAVTAYAAKGDEERIREAGAEAYVSKPISLARFIEEVRGLMKGAPAAVSAPDEDAIQVERSFAVSGQRVFDAWLDAEHVGQWLFATPEGEMVEVRIDPQVGGEYRIVERRGGKDVAHVGRYEAIDPPSRLAFTLAVPALSDQEGRVDISFSGEGEGCTLRLKALGVLPEYRDRTREGWATILDNLARVLEEER